MPNYEDPRIIAYSNDRNYSFCLDRKPRSRIVVVKQEKTKEANTPLLLKEALPAVEDFLSQYGIKSYNIEMNAGAFQRSNKFHFKITLSADQYYDKWKKQIDKCVTDGHISFNDHEPAKEGAEWWKLFEEQVKRLQNGLWKDFKNDKGKYEKFSQK